MKLIYKNKEFIKIKYITSGIQQKITRHVKKLKTKWLQKKKAVDRKRNDPDAGSSREGIWNSFCSMFDDLKENMNITGA